MRIFLDSNILIESPRLQSAHFRALFSYVTKTNSSLWIPQIVLDEVTQKCAERIDDAVASLQKQLQIWSKEALPDSLISNTLVADYRRHLDNVLRYKANIAPYPTIDTREVVSRAVQKKRPFRDKDSGIRDYLIWKTILACFSSSNESVVLITRNTKDFGDQELHQDMKDDLKNLAIDQDAVSIVGGLDVFYDRFMKPALEKLDRVLQALRSSSRYGALDLEASLRHALPSKLYLHSISPADVDLPREANEVTMRHCELESFEVREVVKVEDDYYIANVDATVSGSVEFFIDKADYYVMRSDESERFSITDHDWNDHVMEAEMTSNFCASVTVGFDPESGKLSGIDIEEISRA